MTDTVAARAGEPDPERTMLHREEDDTAEMVAAMAEELRMGFEVVSRIDRPAVTIFGSARIKADDPWYGHAMAVAAGFVTEGFAVVTGGGPGIMEAANRGAKERDGLSVGFNILLPKEQGMNAFVDLGATFKHFYARKVMFVKAAEGFVVFPGGFGTLDELFESLTLIQTGKVRHFPVVLVGREHWTPMLTWVKEELLGRGLISQGDLDLVILTDSVSEAVHGVVGCYRRLCDHLHHTQGA
jgi:uncharacterized protein (TIGR00730 family)